MSKVLLALTLLVLASVSLPQGTLAQPERTHEIGPDDYFTIAYATSAVLSPRNTHVAYTEMRWDKEEDKRNTDLWVVNTATKETRRLTFDPTSDSNAQWSPDESWIYFTSKRKRDDGEKPPYNDKTQVWRVRPQGGEIFAVTREPKGIQSFHLSKDGNSLYFTTSSEEVEDDDWEELRKEFKDLKYGHGVTDLTQLHKLDLVSWRTEKLVDEDRYIYEFKVSPDESKIAMLTRPDPTLISNEGWSRVDIYDMASREIASLPDAMWREQAPSPYGWILGLTWADDNKALGFRVDFDGYPGEVFFAHLGNGAPSIQKLNRPNEVTVEGSMVWMPGTRNFVFAADDYGRRRMYCVENIRNGKQGKDYTLTPGDVSVNAFSFASGKTLAVLRPGMNHPPDVFLTKSPGPNASFDRLTRINPQVDTWILPQLSIYKWTSPDGTPVEGILELPPGYKKGDGPLPLVVAIHGGPTASSRLHFRYWIYGRTLFASKGWALFDPNYRGSTGYGDKFLIDLIGNKNNLDVQDILSGVDALIEEGIADDSKMAVMGWSNGGYLTNCIITHDNRFKAASSGASVFDTVMQWSIEDTPGHVINYNKGLPWEQKEGMHRSSPLYNVDKVTTPTLIHVGENDPRTPQEHSRSLYRSLRYYVDVPTELIIYPGEGHGLTKYSHRKAKLNWDMKWFKRHVLEEEEPTITGS